MVSTNGARIILLIFAAQLVNIVRGSSILFLSPLMAPSHSNFLKTGDQGVGRSGPLRHLQEWNVAAAQRQY